MSFGRMLSFAFISLSASSMPGVHVSGDVMGYVRGFFGGHVSCELSCAGMHRSFAAERDGDARARRREVLTRALRAERAERLDAAAQAGHHHGRVLRA